MTFPLLYHPEWIIYDSTKLDTYIECHRRYFYEHVLGWRPDSPAHDLVFGSAWHCAREHQLLHGYEDINGAFSAFEKEYRKEFPPESDILYQPKTPEAALTGLLRYANEYSSDLILNKVVEIDGKKMTEISGTVPIDTNRKIHYKMDSILEQVEDGKILSMDHKTTSEKWFTSTKWDREFFLSIQNGTYTHCLYCLFPIEQVLGVEFCKTGFGYLIRGSKSSPAGPRVGIRYIPAYKTPEQMSTWLWVVNDLINDLERDMDRLHHCREEDLVMQAFQLNHKSCTDYRGCPYHDFCLAWQNPLQHCYQPEIGFKEFFWNPAEVQTTVKKNLEWQR
jgi:hypothetical protein